MYYKKQVAGGKWSVGNMLFPAGYLLLAVYIVLLISCKQIEVYEKDSSIPNYEWKSSHIVKGSFNIADTVSSYNIYLVLRHNDAYKYNNIWLNVGLQAPGDSVIYQKVNLPLGSDSQGWEGIGMNDIWEVRKALNTEPVRFKKTGEYRFELSQIMRDNPLPNVMNAGLRIERQPR